MSPAWPQTGTDASVTKIHPLVVRITHWINAFALACMILSGWRIYNASPIFDFSFPNWMTLGGWLAGALAWHFAAMWLFVLNGFVYLTYGILSGHFRRNLAGLSFAALSTDTRAAVTFSLAHRLGTYNAPQKLLYIGVLVLGIIAVLSGLAIWKPVQLHALTSIFGGYDFARVVHFFAMTGIVAFILIHITLAALVPSTLIPMITGRARIHPQVRGTK